MKNLIFRDVVVVILVFMLTAVLGCSGSGSGNTPQDNSITKDQKAPKNTDGKSQEVIPNWDIRLKGYNVVEAPATVTLSILRVDQPISDFVYKYQINGDQPWIDVSKQVNAVGIGEFCDIPLNFTTPGKYWITTRIFYDETVWTGIYKSDFVIILEPEK